MARKRKHNHAGTVRIIGGAWRGRKLPFPDLPGLRPSGDRSRETLFNWLQPVLRGARCLDLFAGTGVLGLEAASRGAAKVTLVEKSPVAAAVIRENIAVLGAKQVELVEADAITWLPSLGEASADIVFIDPPFGSGLEQAALALLIELNCIATGGMLYVESARDAPLPNPGPGWAMSREKTLGEVRILLFKKNRKNFESN
jgi:16S rRNA (guanine966-N2)-methyltransferase